MWTLKRRNIRGIKTTKMKFTTLTEEYSLLCHRRNENILEDLEINAVEEKLAQYKQK
jgi:hypothetical protein